MEHSVYDNFVYIMRAMITAKFTPEQIQFVLNTKEPTRDIDFGDGITAHYVGSDWGDYGEWEIMRTTNKDAIKPEQHLDVSEEASVSEAPVDSTPDYEGAFKLACKYLQKGYVDSEDRRGWTVMDWEVFMFKKLEDENANR